MDRCIELKKASKIPQFFITGTEYYASIANRVGRPSYTTSSNGKGYKKIHAAVSGLMELAERYSCNKELLEGKTMKIFPLSFLKKNFYGEKEFFSNPFFREKFSIVDKRLLDDARVIWHRAYGINGEKTWLPMSLLTYMHEITNGMTAGNSLEEAVLHGVCEVIERHLKSVIRENKITPPIIEEKSIKYKTVKRLLDKFRKAGFKVTLMDYSLDLGIPAVAAVRMIGKDKCIVTVGVAPHPEEAAARALTENSQAEIYRDVSYFNHLFSKAKTVDAISLPNLYDKDIAVELSRIERLLNEKGMKTWYVETTDKTLGIPTAFVHISNTYRNNADLTYRNAIIGLVEESVKMKDYRQALKFIKLGESKDGKNRHIYRYYKGVSEAGLGNFGKAAACFLSVNEDKLYGKKKFLGIQTAIAFLKAGDRENFVFHFCRNIKKNPGMTPIYMRSHHFFVKPKMVWRIQKTYRQLQALDKYVNIHVPAFHRQFAKNLNLYTL